MHCLCLCLHCTLCSAAWSIRANEDMPYNVSFSLILLCLSLWCAPYKYFVCFILFQPFTIIIDKWFFIRENILTGYIKNMNFRMGWYGARWYPLKLKRTITSKKIYTQHKTTCFHRISSLTCPLPWKITKFKNVRQCSINIACCCRLQGNLTITLT